MDGEDGAEATLVEAPKKSQVVTEGDPRLRPVQEGVQNNGSVDVDLSKCTTEANTYEQVINGISSENIQVIQDMVCSLHMTLGTETYC